MGIDMGIIVVKVESNWGGDLTCLYRVSPARRLVGQVYHAEINRFEYMAECPARQIQIRPGLITRLHMHHTITNTSNFYTHEGRRFDYSDN